MHLSGVRLSVSVRPSVPQQQTRRRRPLDVDRLLHGRRKCGELHIISLHRRLHADFGTIALTWCLLWCAVRIPSPGSDPSQGRVRVEVQIRTPSPAPGRSLRPG